MGVGRLDLTVDGELRRAISRRFVRWVLLLLGAELCVVGFVRAAIVPLISAVAQQELVAAAAQSTVDLVGWIVSTVWLSVVRGGAGSLDILSTSATLVLAALAIVVVAAPVYGCAVLFARDVEGIVRDELHARDDELRHAYERRNLMISDIAHDLRTPVMGIAGISQAITDGLVADPAEQRRLLGSVRAKAHKLADLSTMLFDFVKLESEGFEVARRHIDLPQLMLREAASAFADAEEAGMTLMVDVPEDAVIVDADETQLGRLVANLLANAVRHNPAGTTIELALGRRAGVADIIVADTGVAIEQDVDELLEPFSRGDAARSGGGSGLGLSIVKGIADMHGYQIELRQPYAHFTKAFVVTCGTE